MTCPRVAARPLFQCMRPVRMQAGQPGLSRSPVVLSCLHARRPVLLGNLEGSGFETDALTMPSDCQRRETPVRNNNSTSLIDPYAMTTYSRPPATLQHPAFEPRKQGKKDISATPPHTVPGRQSHDEQAAQLLTLVESSLRRALPAYRFHSQPQTLSLFTKAGCVGKKSPHQPLCAKRRSKNEARMKKSQLTRPEYFQN